MITSLDLFDNILNILKNKRKQEKCSCEEQFYLFFDYKEIIFLNIKLFDIQSLYFTKISYVFFLKRNYIVIFFFSGNYYIFFKYYSFQSKKIEIITYYLFFYITKKAVPKWIRQNFLYIFYYICISFLIIICIKHIIFLDSLQLFF